MPGDDQFLRLPIVITGLVPVICTRSNQDGRA
jgi:hypothetical protein